MFDWAVHFRCTVSHDGLLACLQKTRGDLYHIRLTEEGDQFVFTMLSVRHVCVGRCVVFVYMCMWRGCTCLCGEVCCVCVHVYVERVYMSVWGGVCCVCVHVCSSMSTYCMCVTSVC